MAISRIGRYMRMSLFTAFITQIFIVLTIAAAENSQIVTMDIAGVYPNSSMSSTVVFMYFEPALATMLCELVSEHKKYFMKTGRTVVK